MFIENAHLRQPARPRRSSRHWRRKCRGLHSGHPISTAGRALQEYPTNPDGRKLRSEMHVVAPSPDATRRVYPATARPGCTSYVACWAATCACVLATGGA